MTAKTDDDLYRKRIDTLTQEAPSKLSTRSCQMLAKKPTFKKFIRYVAEQAPGAMRPFLEKVIKKMPVATAEDKCNASSKRSAAECDENRKAKKAKFEKAKDFGYEAFGVGANYDLQEISYAEVECCDQEKDAQEKSGKDCPPRLDGHEKYAQEKSEKNCPPRLDDQEKDNQEKPGENCPRQLDDQEKDDQEMSGDSSPRQLDDYTLSEIEIGLVGEDPEIWKLLLVDFANLPRDPRDRKDGSRVLEACKKLRFENVVYEVCRVLRTAIKKPHCVPQGYDAKDLRKILQTLDRLQCERQELSIHNSYVQMLLFNAVNAMIDHKQFEDYQKVISHLTECYVRSSAGQGEDLQRTKDKYYDDYNRGRRWLETAKFFDGTGIVLIAVATGVGASTVSKSWTDLERVCFEKVANYLPSLKEVVNVLGADALEQYCRGCFLPGKIEELEKLNDPASDEDDEEADGENDDSDGDGED